MDAPPPFAHRRGRFRSQPDQGLESPSQYWEQEVRTDCMTPQSLPVERGHHPGRWKVFSDPKNDQILNLQNYCCPSKSDSKAPNSMWGHKSATAILKQFKDKSKYPYLGH